MLSQEQKSWIEECRAFAEREIAPVVEDLETRPALRLDLFIKMAKAGLLDLSIRKSTVDYVLAVKEISKFDAGIGVAMSVTNMAVEAIELYGTEEQKRRILREVPLGNGVPIAFALTEKGAGSDVKEIQLEARAEGTSYILSGDKQFITNGDLARLLIVMAKTEEGITAFLVDRNVSGLTVAKVEQKLGLQSINLCNLHFEQCRVPRASILGRVGNGLHVALASLDSGRLGIAAQSLGIAKAAFRSALKYAHTRKQFGKTLFENQAIAFEFADMHVKISAGELLLLNAAQLKDQKRPYALEAAEAKLFCSEMCNDVATRALQIHGGYGYVKGYFLAEKYFRDARATTLYEGTSEIQRIVISRYL